MLFAPTIIEPRRKPIGAVEINESHPLAANLMAFNPLIPQRGMNWMDRYGFWEQISTSTPFPAWEFGERGPVLKMSSTSGRGFRFRAAVNAYAGWPSNFVNMSWAVRLAFSSVAASQHVGQLGQNGDAYRYGRGFGFNQSTGLWQVHADANYTDTDVDGLTGPVAEQWYDATIVTSGINSHSLYIDGAFEASLSSSTGNNLSDSQLILGHQAGAPTGYNHFDGWFEYAAVWARELSVDELQAFHADPYALLRPARQQSFHFFRKPVGAAPALAGSFAEQLALAPAASGGRGVAGGMAGLFAARPAGAGAKASTGAGEDRLRHATVAAGALGAAGGMAGRIGAVSAGAGDKAAGAGAADSFGLAAVLSGAAGTGDARFGGFGEALAGRPVAAGERHTGGGIADLLALRPAGFGARGAAGGIADRLVLAPAAAGGRQVSGVAHLTLRLAEGFSALPPIEIPDRFEVAGTFGEAPVAAVWQPYVALEGIAR